MTINNNDVLQALNYRYATKVFDPTKKIPLEQLNILYESLRLAPSSFGLQFWKFISVSDLSLKKKLYPHTWNQSQAVDCDRLIVLCRKKKIEKEDIDQFINALADARKISVESLSGYKKSIVGFYEESSEDELISWMNEQVHIALGGLLLTAGLLKIDACPIGGFINSEYDKILELDKINLASSVVCAVGYRSSEDKYQSLDKFRYSSQDVIIER